MLTDNARLGRNVGGAASASLVLASIFALFGYDEGARSLDVVKELALASTSYLVAAIMVTAMIKRETTLDMILISLSGSGLSSLLKLFLVDGANGLPAYISRSRLENSVSPFVDLIVHLITFSLLATFIALPFVALGSWLVSFFYRRYDSQSHQ